MGRAEFFKNTIHAAGDAVKNGGEALVKLGGEFVEEAKAQIEEAKVQSKEEPAGEVVMSVEPAEPEVESAPSEGASLEVPGEEVSLSGEVAVADFAPVPVVASVPVSDSVFASDASDVPNAELPAAEVAGKPRDKKRVVVSAAVAVLALFVGLLAGNAYAESRAAVDRDAYQEEINQQKASFEQQLAEIEKKDSALAAESDLSVLVKAEGWSSSKGKIIVKVTGSTDSGKEVKDSFEVTPNEPFVLKDYKAGVYLIAIDPASIKDGNNVYQKDSMKVAFSDRADLQIELELRLDGAATKKKEDEAKAKAEEEAKAKAEAEEKARMEQEAAAAAAAAEASAAPVERTVYVTPTGKKYHAWGCSYLKGNGTAISLGEAQARGLEPCSRCGG